MKNNYTKILFLFILINFGLLQFSFAQNLQEQTKPEDLKKSEQIVNENLEKTIPPDKKFKDKFYENYDGKDFDYKPIVENKVETAWEKFKRAISDFFRNLFSFSSETASGLEIIFKILVWLIIGAAIYFIVRALINKEGVWIFSKGSKKIDLNVTDIDDIQNIDLKALLNKAKLEKNYRLCIRYYYLMVLKSLAEKSIIEWDKEKTNTDYLYEIKDTKTKKEFELVSYIYDYCWYGEFELKEEEFLKTEKNFQSIL